MAAPLVQPMRPPSLRVATMPTMPDVAPQIRYMPSVSPCQAGPVKELCVLRLQREANAVTLAPDGRRAAVGLQDHTLQIWDLEARLLLHVLRGHKYWVNDVAFSRDGVLLASASADKSIKVWQTPAASCKATLQGHMLSVSAVSFSVDRRRLASGSWDKTVCVWDVETASCLQKLSGHTDWVHSVCWAPGGHHVASASSDHSVRVWDVLSGFVNSVLVGHLQTVSCVVYSSNGGYLASGSLDGTVRVWNLQEGALVARLQQEEESSVHAVAFSPDGQYIVVGCGDKSVKVWSLTEQLQSFSGHEDTVQSVAVTADGRAVSCSHDKTLRVWRLPRHPFLYAQVPFVSAPVYMPRPVARAPGSPQAMLLRDRMEEFHERLKNAEAMNKQMREQLEEEHSDEVVERLEPGEDDVDGSCIEEPAAKVPETPPKLQLPKSPAGSANADRLSVPSQCWSILPTTMAGTSAASVSNLPIPHLSCPAGSNVKASPSLPAPCQSMLVQGPFQSQNEIGRPPSPHQMIVEPVTRSSASPQPSQRCMQGNFSHRL